MSTVSSPNGLFELSPRRVFRPWRELAVVALIAMEAVWLSLWYARFPIAGAGVPVVRIYAVFTALLLCSYLLAFGVSALKARLLYQRALFALLLLVSYVISVKLLLLPHPPLTLLGMFSEPVRSLRDFLALIPPELVVFAAVLFVWNRGTDLAEANIEPQMVLANFRLGVVLLILYGLFTRDRGPLAGLALYVFVFTGLVALSAARISLLNRLRGGRDTPFNRQWLLGVFSSVMGVTFLSALLVTVVRDVIASRLGWVFAGLQNVFILLVLVIVLPPFILLLEFLLNIGKILHIDTILAGISEAVRQLLNFFEGIFGPEGPSPSLNVPVARPVILTAILLIFFAVVVVGWRIRFQRAAAQRFDTTESIGPADSVDQWKASLQNSARRLGNRLAQALGFRRAGHAWSAFRVRRIYIQLLALAEKLDQPRPTAQTPLEYLPALQRLLPSVSAELSAITAAYLRVRYGELPETESEVDQIEAAWRRVSALGKSELASRRR